MSSYKTNEEQVEYLKKWLGEHSTSIITGVTMGLLVLFGWRGWQSHLMTQGVQASVLYEQITTDLPQEKKTDITTTAEQLKQKYPSTTYASFSALMQARDDVEKDDISSAKNHLQWVLNHTDSLDAFGHIARLRFARLLLMEDNEAGALSLLASVDPGKFAASYHELRGDILLQQEHVETAKEAYKQALATQNDRSSNQAIIQTKLDDLGADQP